MGRGGDFEHPLSVLVLRGHFLHCVHDHYREYFPPRFECPSDQNWCGSCSLLTVRSVDLTYCYRWLKFCELHEDDRVTVVFLCGGGVRAVEVRTEYGYNVTMGVIWTCSLYRALACRLTALPKQCFLVGLTIVHRSKKGVLVLCLREDKANCVVSQSFCVALLSFRHVVLAFNVFTLLLVFINTGGTEGPLCGHHFGLDQRWRVLSRGE